MKLWRALNAVGTLLFVLGCSDDDTAMRATSDAGRSKDGAAPSQDGESSPSNAMLCDGSTDIVLSAALHDSNFASALTRFAEAHGVLFLYISGTCEFWVNNGSWFTTHGVLDGPARASVQEALAFEELPMVSGQWSAAEDCFDPPRLHVTAARSDVTCDCECPSAPRSVRHMYAEFPALIDTLHDQGIPWQGPIELLASAEPTLEDRQPQAWPLTRNIAQFVVSRDALQDATLSGEALEGVLVDAAEDIRAIRDLSTRYAASYPDYTQPGSYIAVEDHGTVYGLSMRDVMPPFVAR